MNIRSIFIFAAVDAKAAQLRIESAPLTDNSVMYLQRGACFIFPLAVDSTFQEVKLMPTRPNAIRIISLNITQALLSQFAPLFNFLKQPTLNAYVVGDDGTTYLLESITMPVLSGQFPNCLTLVGIANVPAPKVAKLNYFFAAEGSHSFAAYCNKSTYYSGGSYYNGYGFKGIGYYLLG